MLLLRAHHVKLVLEVLHAHKHHVVLVIVPAAVAAIDGVTEPLGELLLRHLRHLGEVQRGCQSRVLCERMLVARLDEQLSHFHLDRGHVGRDVLLGHLALISDFIDLGACLANDVPGLL